jgi:hypothetical protein
LRCAWLDSSTGGVDEGGAIGLQAADCGIGGRMGCGDGRGLVCDDDAASGAAGHGDGVDAVDSRGDIDSSVVRLSVLGKCAHEEREEEDDDLLEGAHLVGRGVVVLVVETKCCCCCYATVANAQWMTIKSSNGLWRTVELI